MEVTARRANVHDIPELVRLYDLLESEMSSLSDLWKVSHGLPLPVEDTLRRMLEDEDWGVLVGTIDDLPFGFLIAGVETMLDLTSVGSIRLVFTQEEARAVGVGSAMREMIIEQFAERGIDRLDAHVLPGHRLAKNFFEAGGFSARHIIMHRSP